jgi:hypothetical protein
MFPEGTARGIVWQFAPWHTSPSLSLVLWRGVHLVIEELANEERAVLLLGRRLRGRGHEPAAAHELARECLRCEVCDGLR